MGAGHSHSHDAPVLGLSATARRVTLGLLLVVAAVTLAGLILLWPTSHPTKDGSSLTAEGVDTVPGRITALTPCEDTGESQGQGPQHACLDAQVTVTGGPSAGRTVPVELIGVSAMSGLKVGDAVNVAEVPGIDGQPSTWAFINTDRTPVLLGFLIVFVAVVIAVAGRKGLFGLLGLIVSGAVLFGFMIPALTSGHPAVAVAIIGSTAIMFVVLYLAHGVSWRTTSAFVGTWLSLLVTTGLGALGVYLSRLSGMSSEETLALAGVLGNLDFPDILTCSLVLGGLGVLNDVTITQASSVWELRAAGPHLTRRELFTSGMRIGRDHIASTIYTIVFAYAGASLSLLLLLSLYNQPLNLLFSTEEFTEEIIRTLGSGIGLVLSVPLTTGVAALTVAGAGGAASRAAASRPRLSGRAESENRSRSRRRFCEYRRRAKLRVARRGPFAGSTPRARPIERCGRALAGRIPGERLGGLLNKDGVAERRVLIASESESESLKVGLKRREAGGPAEPAGPPRTGDGPTWPPCAWPQRT